MREQAEKILEKAMTRKEFLALVGTALVAATGLPAIFGVLSSASDKTKKQIRNGFGAGSFGR